MIKILDPGFYSTIQDFGRFGYRDYGVPVSGAMDSYSSKFANLLLGNSSNAAVIEATMTLPKLKVMIPTKLAIAGAHVKVRVNGIVVDSNAVIQLKTNDVISFGRLKLGFRAYIAVAGGFKTETALNSQSMYQGITSSVKLSKNDLLAFNTAQSKSAELHAKVKYDESIIESSELKVFKGPEFENLTENQQKTLFSSGFNVSKYNSRMAYRLEPEIKNSLQSILTAPVLPGTVQLTPSGQLIVLMRDCQTTGGYPRVLQLTESAINILSQKRTNNTVKFRLDGKGL